MFPSGLSMLWESVDAKEALRSRFGFADFEGGVAWLATTLLDRWSLTVRRCERILISDQNAIAWVEAAESPQGLICKWSRAETSFAKLAATTDLITSLAEHGVPVATPMLTQTGEGREVVAGPSGPLPVSVQPAVDGAPLDLNDGSAVREAGVQLARLHLAMAGLSDSPARLAAGTPQLDLHARVGGWMAGSARPTESDDWLRRELSVLPPLDVLPQLVHNDYRSANLVTSGSTINAILDFDEVAWDYCVSDLAHTGVYLETLFRDWGPTLPEARRLLLEGYQAVRALTGAEREWFEFLTRWFSVAAGWPIADAQGE